jgi:hypothetical protein
MGLANAYRVIDKFKIEHASTQNGQNYQLRLADLKIRMLKQQKVFRKFKQVFNQTMSNK